MSKIGGWHSCYNSDRTISNELGGKWELFFEETRDESGAVGYEWDKDFDNNPLNLLGVMIKIKSSSSSGRLILDINNRRAISMTASSNASATLKVRIVNGCLDGSWFNATSDSSVVTTSNTSNFLKSELMDSIKEFAFSFTDMPVNSNIKIYVLRGV